MKIPRAALLIPVLIAVALPAAAAPPADDAESWVVMRKSGVNLRTAPTTQSIVVSLASKGEVFRCLGERDDWYLIAMHSGEPRFVWKKLSARIGELLPGHHMSLPDDPAVRRDLAGRAERALARAAREAEDVLPAALDADRHLRYRRILEDRYVREAIAAHEVQSALSGRLLAGE